jgi:hypothetical protein
LAELLTLSEGLFAIVLYLSFALLILLATVAAPVYVALGAVRVARDLSRRLAPRRVVPASLLTTDRARGRAVAALADGYAEGRLDLAELDRRASAAYGARTAGELAALFADLPAPAPQREGRLLAFQVIVGVALLLFFSLPARIVGALLVLGTLFSGRGRAGEWPTLLAFRVCKKR